MPGGKSDWSYDKAKTVSFLDDVINESLRLKPALMTGLYRVTPPTSGGLQIDEVRVPADVNVFVPIQLIQRDPRYWPRPLEFIPERWSEDSGEGELAAENAPFMPFSLGTSFATPHFPLDPSPLSLPPPQRLLPSLFSSLTNKTKQKQATTAAPART